MRRLTALLLLAPLATAEPLGARVDRLVQPYVDAGKFVGAVVGVIAPDGRQLISGYGEGRPDERIARAMEGLFVMEDWHNIGPDYDKTLMAWHANFERAWPSLSERYGDRFYRMWRYYLLSAAGGFRSRSTQLWQIVMTRPGTAQPDSRVN